MSSVIDLAQVRPDPRADALERLKAGVEKLKVAMRLEDEFQAQAAIEEIDANYNIIQRYRP